MHRIRLISLMNSSGNVLKYRGELTQLLNGQWVTAQVTYPTVVFQWIDDVITGGSLPQSLADAASLLNVTVDSLCVTPTVINVNVTGVTELNIGKIGVVKIVGDTGIVVQPTNIKIINGETVINVSQIYGPIKIYTTDFEPAEVDLDPDTKVATLDGIWEIHGNNVGGTIVTDWTKVQYVDGKTYVTFDANYSQTKVFLTVSAGYIIKFTVTPETDFVTVVSEYPITALSLEDKVVPATVVLAAGRTNIAIPTAEFGEGRLMIPTWIYSNSYYRGAAALVIIGQRGSIYANGITDATWSSIIGRPTSQVEAIDDAVLKRHSHTDRLFLDSLHLVEINGVSVLYSGENPVIATEPTVAIEYGVVGQDNVVTWQMDPPVGTAPKFIRFSTNGGLDWDGNVQLPVGPAAPATVIEYSSSVTKPLPNSTSAWSSSPTPTTKWIRFTIGSTVGDAIQIKGDAGAATPDIAIQFSATGGTADTEWHDVYASATDKYLRFKLNNVWGTAIFFKGQQGDKASNVIIKYATPENYLKDITDPGWSLTFVDGMIYMRISTDGGSTFGSAIKFVAKDLKLRYWDATLNNGSGDWSDIPVASTTKFQISSDNGTVWSKDIPLPVGPKGDAAPNLVIKFSVNGSIAAGSVWDSEPSADRKYLRFSVDGGQTWPFAPVRYMANDLVVEFSDELLGTWSTTPNENTEYVRIYEQGTTPPVGVRIRGAAAKMPELAVQVPNDPNGSLIYQLEVQVSTAATFDSGNIVLTLDSSISNDRSYMQVFDGTNFIMVPSGGLTSTYYNTFLTVTLGSLSSVLPYYIRYRWKTTTGVVYQWYGTKTPTCSTTTPPIVVSGVSSSITESSPDNGRYIIPVTSQSVVSIIPTADFSVLLKEVPQSKVIKMYVRVKNGGLYTSTWKGVDSDLNVVNSVVFTNDFQFSQNGYDLFEITTVPGTTVPTVLITHVGQFS